MLDGAARLESLAKEVVRQGESAIAMTDHGNVFGAFDFYKTMKKVGVKPIIGIEAYVAPESRFEKRRVKWADGGDDAGTTRADHAAAPLSVWGIIWDRKRRPRWTPAGFR